MTSTLDPAVATGGPTTAQHQDHAVPERPRLVLFRVAVGFGLPLALYYGLRAAGIGIFLALLAGAVVSAVTGLVPLVRHRHLDGIAAYTTIMMVGSVAVSLVSGSTRFLLAREALLTGVTGLWFIVSIWARHPLAYLFSRPLVEGRFRWPAGWDDLWDRSPRFRRMWRVSSLLWGIGTLVDAALRVLMAYTLPPDQVPALGTALYVATSVVLIVVTNVYYGASGIYNRSSAIYPNQGPITS
jgi:hypothetical protein